MTTTGLVYAADYPSLAQAIAALPKGGGEVILGTGSFVAPANLFPADHIQIIGMGPETTWLTYSGSGPAVAVMGTAAAPRQHCGLFNLGIDVTTAPASVAALQVENAQRCISERLRLRSQDTAHTLLRMVGSAGEATYYDTFRDFECTTSGIVLQYAAAATTPGGSINRHHFERFICNGHNGIAIVDDTTIAAPNNNDSSVFLDWTAEIMGSFARLGPRFANNTFIAPFAEQASGVADNGFHNNAIYRSQGISWPAPGHGNTYQ